VTKFQIVSDLLTGDAPLATGHAWLSQWRSQLQTAKNKEELIRRYSSSISINGTDHSWCVGNAKGMGCGGLCIFEAQSCVDCRFGVIGKEHRSVWEGIRDQQGEVLALNDVGPGGKARASQILATSLKVLSRLDGSEKK
jgi:hypothetical protein